MGLGLKNCDGSGGVGRQQEEEKDDVSKQVRPQPIPIPVGGAEWVGVFGESGRGVWGGGGSWILSGLPIKGPWKGSRVVHWGPNSLWFPLIKAQCSPTTTVLCGVCCWNV